jgi:transposase
MYYKPVTRPDRTVIVKNNGNQYVYLTRSVTYSPELKRTCPDRISIGKLNDEGLLIPNKNYFAIFGEPVELELQGDRADYVAVGPHLVVSKIADKLSLYALLDSVFPDKADKILDIATFMVMSENNVMQCFEDYGFHHSLFHGTNFTDTTITKMLSGLSVASIDTFIKSWVTMQKKENIYVSYDSSNMNSVAGSLTLAEYGHAKDNPALPQINVSIGYNQTNQIPLFYELYPGSIIDNSECEKMVERAKRYGCEEIGFILDRGYFSLNNIRYFEKNGYDYILMTKGNSRFIKEAIEECIGALKEGYQYFMSEYELFGKTIEKNIFNTEQKQYIHVYYNGVEAEKEKVIMNQRFEKIDKQLEEKKRQILKRQEDVASYKKYYHLKFDENGYFLNYRRKEKAIKEQISRAGFFAIITSKKMDAYKALEIYRDRDAVEKVFRNEKSYLGNDVFRVHTDERWESKVFISFVALIIRNEIYKSLKPLYQKNRKEYTVPKVLREYDKIGVTKLSDNRYHVRYKLTKKQKAILKELGINETEYNQFTDEIITPLEQL